MFCNISAGIQRLICINGLLTPIFLREFDTDEINYCPIPQIMLYWN